MKILMITGASRSVIWFRKELISYLKNKGNEIFIISCDEENKNEIESLGVKFYCAGGDNRDTGIISNIKYIFCIKKLVKQIKPNKIMTFQVKPNTFGIVGAKLAGYKDIIAMVEGLGNSYNQNGMKNKIINFVASTLYHIAFSGIPKVFFLNENNKQVFIDKKFIKQEQAVLINGIGVDLNKYSISIPRNTDIIKFIMVARVEKEKGIIEYCEAAKQILDKGYNAIFEYYGVCDNSENPILEYEDYVKYCGYTSDIASALKDNHVMVLPTYYNEGLPRSIMEAMAMGKPIITTNRPGCDKTVINGYNGFFVEERNPQSLVDKMIYFIENSEQIELMGRASRKIAEEEFDSDIINEKIWSIINN